MRSSQNQVLDNSKSVRTSYNVPVPKTEKKIGFNDDHDASKSKLDLSALDQSVHDLNDVVSQYTAYMKEK